MVGTDRPDVDLDRAAGALLGLAAGDALGAGYEFTTPSAGQPIVMAGGGVMGWAPGEWTDDTAQAVAIAEGAATGSFDLEVIGAGFLRWFAGQPRDVGISTRAVLAAATSAGDLPRSAAEYFSGHPRGAAGNGSLMRTAPVALAFLGDDDAIVDAALRTSALTHADPRAGEACVLWCIAIDRAVRQGRLDGVRDGLALLPPTRRDFWQERLAEAESRPLASFAPNGYVVTALQAAHAAIHQTSVPTEHPCRHLQDALVTAVKIGDDTDTVAAIAGQVLGARWGASAVPWRWRRIMHGWPGLRSHDLVRLAVLTASRGTSDSIGWPAAPSLQDHGHKYERQVWCAPLPDDPDLLVGNLPGLPVALERGVDAVVSLCRVGADEVGPDVEHVQVRLVDKSGTGENPNGPFVITDTVDAVRTLRAEGKRVYLHCQGGRSRTATVAAGYLSGVLAVPAMATLDRLKSVLPEARLTVFADVLEAEFPG